MHTKKQIVSIPTKSLHPHPANPNQMSDASFKKLKAHIKRTENYEPAIVRPHPSIANSYQILNGHHRIKALKELGVSQVDCVIWHVDDDEAAILLATLNRLSGSDILEKKSNLIKTLAKRFNTKELTKLLPDKIRTIERLKDLKAPANFVHDKNLMLNSIVFFLDDDQQTIVEQAISKAIDKNTTGSKSQKRNTAIVKIAQNFNGDENEN